MTARTYAMESVTYRTAGLIDDSLADGAHDGTAVTRAFEEYAVEASIAKVGGTEVLDYVLDENIQIHGANGYVRDYPAERYYRDSRVNRIFEGTNEVNRMLNPGMLIRRALKGDLPLIPAAKRLQEEVLSPSAPSARSSKDTARDEALRTVSAFKKVVLMVLGTAMQHYGHKLNDEQEILSYAADIMIDTYAAESSGHGPPPRLCTPTRIFTRRLRSHSSTTRRSAWMGLRATRWPRWPKATHSTCFWLRSAGFSRWLRSTP